VAGWADLAPDDDAAPWCLLLEAGERLDPMALPWLVHAARQSPQAAAFYWDEDTLRHAGGRAPAREERHVRPLLRRAFDPEAMLELNIVGRSLAVRASALQAVAPALAAADAALSPARRRGRPWSGPWPARGAGACAAVPAEPGRRCIHGRRRRQVWR
jgi:hypothetical protein